MDELTFSSSRMLIPGQNYFAKALPFEHTKMLCEDGSFEGRKKISPAYNGRKIIQALSVR